MTPKITGTVLSPSKAFLQEVVHSLIVFFIGWGVLYLVLWSLGVEVTWAGLFGVAIGMHLITLHRVATWKVIVEKSLRNIIDTLDESARLAALSTEIAKTSKELADAAEETSRRVH